MELWIPLLVGLGLFLFVAPAYAVDAGVADGAVLRDAGADAPSLPSADGGQEAGDVPTSTEQAQHLRVLLGQLRDAVQGKLSVDLPLGELCKTDLNDEEAVSLARKKLSAELAQLRSKKMAQKPERDGGLDAGASRALDAAADASDGGGDEAGVQDAGGAVLSALREQVIQARIAVLSLPREKRLALVSLDRDNTAQRKVTAKVREERLRAEQEKQRAERARRAALREAQQARTLAARAFANEMARIEGVRADQATYRQTVAEQTQRWTARVSKGEAIVTKLLDEQTSVQAGSPEAASLIDRISSQLDPSRQTVEQLLHAYRQMPLCPRFAPSKRLDAHLSKLSGEDRKKLSDAKSALAHTADKLDAQLKQALWIQLKQAVTQEKTLNGAWIELLDKVPAEKRGRVLGFGNEGVTQLKREMARLRVEVQWYRMYAVDRLRVLAGSITQPLWIGRALWILFSLAALIGVLRFTHKRSATWLEQLRVFVVRNVRRRLWLNIVESLIVNVQLLLGEILLFAGVLLARKLLGSVSAVPEINILLQLALLFATYRLAVAVGHRVFVWAARAGEKRGSLPKERSARIRTAVRVVVRYLFGVGIILIVAASTLGKGYLYTVLHRIAWGGGALVFLALIRSWRKDIADAYLKRHRDGTLAGLVTSTQDRWYGFAVALAAFVFVLAQGIQQTAKRFVLGFEQTRKALAFLFRRRLERQATVADKHVPSLPAVLERRLTESPNVPTSWLVDVYPQMDTLVDLLEQWREGEIRGSVLVTGGPGYGKTSWMREAKKRMDGTPCRYVRLERRLLTEQELFDYLVEHLDLTVEGSCEEQIVGALNDGPRRAILFDDLQLLLLRGVQTFAAWTALTRIIYATNEQVFWLGSVDQYAWQFLTWQRKGHTGFDDLIVLRPWTETEIEQLIAARMDGTDIEIAYDDLVIEHLDGVEREAQLVSTRQEYVRLLWDYADGCPRVALNCWRASLFAEHDKKVRVRLFQRPDLSVLERLREDEMFLLGAIVWHGSLAARDAVRSLRMPLADCDTGMDRFRSARIAEVDRGRYRITTSMSRAVIRYLKRNHLIEE